MKMRFVLQLFLLLCPLLFDPPSFSPFSFSIIGPYNTLFTTWNPYMLRDQNLQNITPEKLVRMPLLLQQAPLKSVLTEIFNLL